MATPATLIAAAVVRATFLLSCIATADTGSMDSPTSNIPTKFTSTLVVNTINLQRFVAASKCELEGAREIMHLLSGSRFEEMWAFLPHAESSGNCEWHEIGHNEKSSDEDAFVSVDQVYLGALMAEHQHIVIYHFHPAAYFRCPIDGERDCVTGALISDLRFSMPSPSDIHFMMDATSRFYHHQPHGRIVHKVITPNGIVEYSLTEHGRRKYESDKDTRTQGLYIKLVAASSLADEDIGTVVAGSSGNLGYALPGMAQSLTTDYLNVSFSLVPIATDPRPAE